MNHSHTTKFPALTWVNIGLRGLMETALVLGLGYLGYLLGNQTIWKVLLTSSYLWGYSVSGASSIFIGFKEMVSYFASSKSC